MPRIRTVVTAVALAAAVTLSGCAAPVGLYPERGVVRVAAGEPLGELIPALVDDRDTLRVIENLYSGLVSYGPGGGWELDAASAIETEDAKTWTVTLRPDLRFSDGSVLDANTFVETWTWAAQPGRGAPDRHLFAEFAGYGPELAAFVEEGGLVVVDDSTFEIHLTRAVPELPARLGLPIFFPLPAAALDDIQAYAESPVGNGPYLIDGDDAWRPGEYLDLAPNPAYSGSRTPRNDGLRLTFAGSHDTAYADVLAGYLDVIDDVPVSLVPRLYDDLRDGAVPAPVADLTSIVIPMTTEGYAAAANLEHLVGVEGELRRRALSLAIDRERIALELFHGTAKAAVDATPPVLPGRSDRLIASGPYTFDPEAALELWTEADAKKPWEGPLRLAYREDSTDPVWVGAVADRWRVVLGIDVELVAYPDAAALAAVLAPDESGERAFAQTVFIDDGRADEPAVFEYVRERYTDKGERNVSGIDDDTLDRQFPRTAAGNLSARADLVARVEDLVAHELPIIPLWSGVSWVAHGPRIAELEVDWRGLPLYWAIRPGS